MKKPTLATILVLIISTTSMAQTPKPQPRTCTKNGFLKCFISKFPRPPKVVLFPGVVKSSK